MNNLGKKTLNDKEIDNFQKILNNIDEENIGFLSEEIKELKEHSKFFLSKGFILTDEACLRMAKLVHYIRNKIPVLLEGPTGTSKTRTTLIACDYIKYKKNLDKKKNKQSDDSTSDEENEDENEKEEDEQLLRFNLSAETKIDDLLVKYIGDKNSASGLKIEEGLFYKAYTKGRKILLDEINLAPKEVLECIQQAIDSGVLSIECSGKILEKHIKAENFSVIATQNPNKGAFANKRQELGEGFLSRFQKINFPNFSQDELTNIALGLAKKAKYKGNENLIRDIVKFHMDWQEETNIVDDVQCFTIREIEGVITALADNKNPYDIIMTVYGSRYQKEMKEKLKKKLTHYDTLKVLKPGKLDLIEEFHHCFVNKNLKEAVYAVMFSLQNEKNPIITGLDGNGLTQVARWCAKCYNMIVHKKENQQDFEDILCLCTKNLQCSDLIGITKPVPKKNNSNNNKILEFKEGFLIKAIKTGRTVVLDCINEANATVGERLNGLLDKKNSEEEAYFDVPENTEELQVKIHKNFRMICTCNINKIKEMSPAFVNRFDVIVLENQLEDITDDKLNELITYFMLSFERIPKKKIEIKEKYNIKLNEDSSSEEEQKEIEEKEKIKTNEEIKKELIKQEKKFSDENKKLIEQVIKKLNLLPKEMLSDEEKSKKDYTHQLTMAAISRFCFSIMKLKKEFQGKYVKYNISETDIVDTVFELLFREKSENIIISENIFNALLEQLIEENKKKSPEEEKYFFEESSSLKVFTVTVYLSSLINLYLCVVSPPGSGKTTSARAIAEIRAKLLNQEVPFYIHTFHSSTKPND